MIKTIAKLGRFAIVAPIYGAVFGAAEPEEAGSIAKEALKRPLGGIMIKAIVLTLYKKKKEN